MDKAMAELAAHVSINTVDARASVNLLKREIRELTHSWQGDYHAMLAAGRGDEALQRKAHGLKDVYELLGSTITKVKKAINNSSGSKGTQKYRRTLLDLKQLQSKYARVGAQIKHNDEILSLHNERLRTTSQREQSNTQIEHSRIQALRDAGHETEADTEQTKSYNLQLKFLQQREQALSDTIANARRNHLNNDNNPDYTRLVTQLNQVKDAYVRVSNEEHDFDTGLTTGKKYDDLYNQSTNKVISSLKSLRGSAEAGRIEYQRLTQNIGNETHVLDMEKNKARTILDQSGEQSIAFERENSKLQSLNDTFKYHAARIHTLGASYGMMSESVARHTDHVMTSIQRLNHVSHASLQTAHSLAAASFTLGSGFIYGEKQAMGLENEFNRIKNLLITSHETYRQADGEIRQMGHDTAQMSMKYGESQQTIAKGYEALVRRGYTGRQALASQKSYLQGAIASGDKYNDVMDTAASTLEAFGMRSNKTRRMVGNTKTAVNQLAYAADLTATDFSGIGYGMKFTGATAHSANQSLSETASALGVLSNNGQNATNAGFGLRKVLNSFIAAKDTKSWKKILPQLGLSAKDFQTAQGHFKSLSTMMGMLNNHMKGMSSAQKTDIFHQLFGATGQESALILARNTGNLANLNKQVAKSQNQDHGKGYAARIARKNMNSTQMQMKRLQQAGSELTREYANGLNPVFRGLAHYALKLANSLSKLPTGFKDTIAIGATVIPIMTGIAFTAATITKTFSVWKSGILKVGQSLRWMKGNLTGATDAQDIAKQKTNDLTKSTDENNKSNQDNDQIIGKVAKDQQGNLKITMQSTDQQNKHSKSVGVDDKATQQASKNLKNNTKTVDDNSKSEKNQNKLKQTNSKLTKNNSNIEKTNTGSTEQNSKANQQNANSTDSNSNAKSNNSNNEQNDTNAIGSDTKATNKNTNSQNSNSNALNRDTGSLKTHSAAENADSGSGSSTTSSSNDEATLKNGKRVPLKALGVTGLAEGGVVGATDLATGNTKNALPDTVGTAGGTVTGGAIGSLAGPEGTAIGSQIGAIAGPIIAEKVGKSLKPITKKLAAQDKRNNKKYNFKNHIREREHKETAQTTRDLEAQKYAETRLGKTISGASLRTQNFVHHFAKDERRAESNYLEHRGRMTKAQRAYYRDMSKRAINYEKQNAKRQRQRFKAERKAGAISEKQYKRDLRDEDRYEKKRIRAIKRAERNVEKDSNKSYARRKKALDKFNKESLKDLRVNSRKRLKLRRYLDRHEGNIDAHMLRKITKESKKDYLEQYHNAYRTYRRKRSIYRRQMENAIHSADHQRGISARTRRKLIDNAKDTYKSRIGSAARYRNRVISKDRSFANSQIRMADKQRNSGVKAAGAISKHWAHAVTYAREHPIKVRIKKIYETIHKHAGGTLDTQALHLAIGNLPGITHDENAVINDGTGQELVKLPNGQLVLPSGRNIHTVLPKGTSVFDALDTRKILSIFKSLSSTPTHFASGSSDTSNSVDGMSFDSSDNSNNGLSNIGSLSNTAHKTKKNMSKINDIIDDGYKQAADAANGHLQDLDTNSDSSWQDVYEKTKQHIKDIHHDTSNRFEDLMDWLDKTQAHSNSKTYHHLDTTVRYFKSHFGMISPITGKSMRHGTSIINSGIRAIDRVLKQFGGNSHVLNEIHFATGTSTPMMKKQLAVVNDAHSGPTQEAIVSQSGKVRMPRGRNVVTALNPGDTVLNGSDTQYAIKHGLIPHYKLGLKSALGILRLFKRFNRSPTRFATDSVDKMTSSIGDTFTRGINTMVRKGATPPAVKWSQALWSFIHNLINPPQSSSELLNYAHKIGNGRRYVWGASGPSSYDCSGLVMRALQHFGIDVPHFSGTIVRMFPRISKADARPGDLIGNNTHIGIVSDNGAHHYYSAYNPSSHPNILTNPVNSSYFPGTPIFSRVSKLAKNNATKNHKNPLWGLIRHELGSRAIGWISTIGKLMDSFIGGGSIGNPAGDSVSRWKPVIRRAANAMHVHLTGVGMDRILNRINTESKGDPTIHQNGGPAIGLIQYEPRTWGAWALPGHHDMRKGYDELLAMFNDSNWESDIWGHSWWGPSGHPRYSSVPTHGYWNGGLSVSDKLAHISEGNNPEMILPLTDKTRAIQLMLQSLQYMFGNQKYNNNSNNKQNNNADDQRFERELIKSNQDKDLLINKLLRQSVNLTNLTKTELNKMTILIKTIERKPVISSAQIYHANRKVTMNKLRLRNFNRGTF